MARVDAQKFGINLIELKTQLAQAATHDLVGGAPEQGDIAEGFRRYFEDGGNTSPEDDIDFDGLKEYLTSTFVKTQNQFVPSKAITGDSA